MNAAEQLQWSVTLLDKYTGNADRMAGATEKFAATLDRAKKMLDQFEGKTQSVNRAANMFAGFSGPWGVAVGVLKLGATWAFDLAEGLGSAAWEAGKFVVNAMGFKETALSSFELILGNAEQAKALYKDASDFARVTPFTTQETVGSFQGLLGSGYNVEQTKILFQALGDAASFAGVRAGSALQAMQQALSRVHGREFVDMIHAKELVLPATEAGITMPGVYQHIAKIMGTSPEAVKAMEASGSLSSEAFVKGFVETIRDKMGGKVGNAMLKQSHTIAGLFSTISSAPFDFITNMDLSQSRGFNAFKGFLENIANLFDVTSSSGGKFAALFDHIFNDTFGDLFEGLSGPDGAKKLDEFFTKAVHFAGQLYDTTSKFVTLLATVAPTLQTVETVLDKMTDVLSGKTKANLLKNNAHAQEADKLGFDLAGQGLTYEPPTIEEQAGGRAPQGNVDIADRHDQALADSVKAAVTLSDIGDKVNAPAGAHRAPMTFVFNLDVSKASDPAGVARAIADMLPAELERLFDRLALESGRSS